MLQLNIGDIRRFILPNNNSILGVIYKVSNELNYYGVITENGELMDIPFGYGACIPKLPTEAREQFNLISNMVIELNELGMKIDQLQKVKKRVSDLLPYRMEELKSICTKFKEEGIL